MKKWEELSMAEKVPYLRLGIHNGITDIDTIKSTYNQYSNGGKYTVKRGDSLWKISRDNGLSLDEY